MDLQRFIDVQNQAYFRAFLEIKKGKKVTHWMWYIFPQLKSLGQSYNSQFYGIENLEHAKNYLKHPILGKRLLEISNELLKFKTNNPIDIFGEIDAQKLKSCMTLFSLTTKYISIFKEVLNKFFKGELDEKTLSEIGNHSIYED